MSAVDIAFKGDAVAGLERRVKERLLPLKLLEARLKKADRVFKLLNRPAPDAYLHWAIAPGLGRLKQLIVSMLNFSARAA